MTAEDKRLIEFLTPQVRDHGGQLEIAPGLWGLLVVDAKDEEANALASSLMVGAPFAYESGMSEDDRWVLYYVDTVTRDAAAHWLDDYLKMVSGQIRPAAPAVRELMRELPQAPMPHRIAQKLVDFHACGKLSAGSIREPALVRSLLDRMHASEPLFLTAFHSLLANHLVDMIVLLQQMITEDLAFKNEMALQSLSTDPLLKRGQIAAAEIRSLLTRFHVINPLDQQKNSGIINPYAAFMDVIRDGEHITAPIGGTTVNLPRTSFVNAIRTTRRNLYRGADFKTFDTQAPWMREDIAYSFRFIKQRLDARRELSSLDGLYMLERAVEV